MPQNDPQQRDIAERLLNEASIAGDLPVEVMDAAGDARQAIKDVLATGDQAAKDLADLDSRRDLIPATGFQRLQAEAVADADERAKDASRRVERSLEALKSELTEATLPRLAGSDREILARDSLRTALGEATGDALIARALGVVKHGDAETCAVMWTPFFKTFLISRGCKNIDADIKRLKLVAAARELGEGSTPRQRAAQAAMQKLGSFSAAHTSAQLALRGATRQRRAA